MALRMDPGEEVIAELITDSALSAVTSYLNAEISERQMIINIIKAIPIRRYVGICEAYGLIPRSDAFVADVSGRLTDCEARIRDLERRVYMDINGHPDRP